MSKWVSVKSTYCPKETRSSYLSRLGFRAGLGLALPVSCNGLRSCFHSVPSALLRPDPDVSGPDEDAALLRQERSHGPHQALHTPLLNW